MLPCIDSPDENARALSAMLSTNDHRVEYPLQFNYPAVESLKQHPSSIATTLRLATADGIVPDMCPGFQVLHTPSTTTTLLQNMPTPRKRKSDLTHTYHDTEYDNSIFGESIPRDAASPDESKITKKQRRLVKNREAAQLFRQRQKEYINNLELKAAELTSANTEANARVELLTSENKLMREQLVYLRNFMKQAVSYSFPHATVVPINQQGSMSTTLSPQQVSPMPAPVGSFFDMEAGGYSDLRIRMSNMFQMGSNSTAAPTRPAMTTTAIAPNSDKKDILPDD